MSGQLGRRAFLGQLALAALAARQLRGGDVAPKPEARFPFYAMDTGLRGPDVDTPEKRLRVLHDLGYWGIDYALDHDGLPRVLELADRYQVALACVYLSPALEDAPDPRLAESIARMKGRNTRIELAIRSHAFKPSDPAGDARGLDLLHRVSDMAADTGPVVSVYPHTGLWTERAEDGARLAAASGRKNVGTNFNLVHWKWVNQIKPLTETLKDCLPYLLAVSVNGLEGKQIVPLDGGDYDLAGFVRLLVSTGYRGPVGVQGYGIPGPSVPTLRRSRDAWEKLLRTSIER